MSAPLPKVAEFPPNPLDVDFTSKQVKTFRETLWRIFVTTGDHALAWNELRHYGPLDDMRFDPHPLPKDRHDVGVLYSSTSPETAFAEVFQDTRIIDRADKGRTLVSWTPTRDLMLLDLTTNFPVRNGAAAAMMMDDKRHTQNWARGIYEQLGTKVDGLWHLSSITSEPMVTLFSRTEVHAAFPIHPDTRAALADAAADVDVEIAADYLNYGVL